MRVLIVDDNESYLHILGEAVRDCGHRVLLATDGKQAREFLEVEQVDAIISDFYMPALDGMRFHSYVREFLGLDRIPFLFVSGFATEDVQDSVLHSELDYFFSKTEPLSDLLTILNQYETART